uniref:Anosmin-1 n=1 Tax=Glossina brevipalpis TaxID=37001 RepID=A0A1A9X196_9MUSC
MYRKKECKCYSYIFITLCTIIMAQNRVCGRQHKRNNVYLRDKIIELQCYARCETATITQFDKCLKQCQLELIKAPRRGYCPFNSIFKNMNIPLQGLSCLYNCSYDYDCPEVHKCCQSTCGSVCVEPWGVRDDTLLPPIPKIEEYTLIKYEQKVEINCTINSLQTNSTYFFHVESRHHVGHSLRPRKFGAWQYQPVDKIAELHDYNSKLFSTKIGFHLRAVHWYQVRVAAINAYGFRGYSEPSQAFTLPNRKLIKKSVGCELRYEKIFKSKLQSDPKPPKPPADLKVVSSHFDGKHYTVKIVWCTSKSNLPIEKYKIIWALYVKTKDESFISNETYVKERHQYEISNLLPDSSYYIQVQAMSINGRRRLKSEPRFMLYNTTTAPTHAYKPLKCGKEPQHIVREGSTGI